jgi:hypothetical protein
LEKRPPGLASLLNVEIFSRFLRTIHKADTGYEREDLEMIM